MGSIDGVFSTISGWLKSIVSLGLELVLVFLVIDVLYPNQTDIVGSIGNLISSFTDRGIVGLVILIAVVAIASDD